MTTTRRTIGTMPAHARVWVYKCAQPFNPEIRERILSRGQDFTSGWAAHGNALDACVDVLHDHFVVIAVDEQQALASGCSIDKSVRFVQDLERDLGLSLTDRMVVAYESPEGVATVRASDLPHLLRTGALNADTLVFDDLLSVKSDLDERFRVPLRDTWMARYL